MVTDTVSSASPPPFSPPSTDTADYDNCHDDGDREDKDLLHRRRPKSLSDAIVEGRGANIVLAEVVAVQVKKIIARNF